MSGTTWQKSRTQRAAQAAAAGWSLAVVPQGWVMGLMVLRVCSNEQEDRAERSLSRLAGAAKLASV